MIVVMLYIPVLSTNGEDGQTASISSIRFKGLKSVPLDEVKPRIATPLPPKYKFWAKKPEFDEEILKDDTLRIKRLYANYGYYDTEVTYSLKYNKDKSLVDVTISIKEGKPVILRSISFDINGTLDEPTIKDIKKSITIKEKKVFSAIKYQESKGIISGILANSGYARADVQGKALVNKREKWADVRFSITPGDIYNFGDVVVSGNKTVETEIVTREFEFKKGDPYSAKKIKDTESNIFALGLFSSVIMDTDFDDETKVANVRVTLRERKYSSIRLGVGYGTEDKFRGQIIWTKRNFFGGGRTFELSGKFSFLTQRAESTLTQPFAIGKSSELIGSIVATRDDLPSYTAESIIGIAGLSKRFKRNYRATANYSYRLSQLSNISQATEEFVARNNYLLSLLSAGFERNTASDALNPRRGTIAGVTLETSLKDIGSEVNYLKWIVNLRGYKEVFSTVLASRLDLGVIQPLGDTGRLNIPIFSRFFAGGSTTVRGFPFQKLGPLDANDEPIGGNTLLVGSVESRFPLYKKIGGVVFFDFGNVYPKEWDFNLADIKYSPGAGLRYNTLIGPLRVDVGYAINPDPGIGHFQFFFSIGHAF
jgi:outer membrane protein insertion porin family/translocation and assembly module TamA